MKWAFSLILAFGYYSSVLQKPTNQWFTRRLHCSVISETDWSVECYGLPWRHHDYVSDDFVSRTSNYNWWWPRGMFALGQFRIGARVQTIHERSNKTIFFVSEINIRLSSCSTWDIITLLSLPCGIRPNTPTTGRMGGTGERLNRSGTYVAFLGVVLQPYLNRTPQNISNKSHLLTDSKWLWLWVELG